MKILNGIPQNVKQKAFTVKDQAIILELDEYIEVKSIGYARNLKSDLSFICPDRIFTVWSENGKNFIGRIK